MPVNIQISNYRDLFRCHLFFIDCWLVFTFNTSFLLLRYLHAQSLSHVWLFVIPWTVARQAPLSMGISRQEYWSGLPFPTSGDLPDQGSNPVSCVSCTGRQIVYHWTTWEAQDKGRETNTYLLPCRYQVLLKLDFMSFSLIGSLFNPVR